MRFHRAAEGHNYYQGPQGVLITKYSHSYIVGCSGFRLDYHVLSLQEFPMKYFGLTMFKAHMYFMRTWTRKVILSL